MGFCAKVLHSFRVWPRRAMDGTRNKMSPELFVSFSAIRRDVKVFPVPHAIIKRPRFAVLKCS